MFMLAARLVYLYVIDKLAAWRWLVLRAVHPRGSVERVHLEEKGNKVPVATSVEQQQQ